MTVQQVRRTPAVTAPSAFDPVPTPTAQQLNVIVRISGPMANLVDAAIANPRSPLNNLRQNPRSTLPREADDQTDVTMNLWSPDVDAETASVRLRYHNGIETVTMPFEVTTGIGL